jgi:uncharacterized membrane protein
MNTQIKSRIVSIDILRGFVMVLMALDHVRDFFHIGANSGDPLDLETTNVFLFFTRWITHFCAPIFIFLSGLSIYLQSLRKSRKALTSFVIKRGIWLIAAEWFIVSFGWTFNPEYLIFPFQVIWAIGISMLALGVLLWLRASYLLILVMALVIVFGHNLLDSFESAPDFNAGFFWNVLHSGVFVRYPVFGNHSALIVYPFLPWLGLMMLGYCAGILFTDQFAEAQRKRILLRMGVGLILLFVSLRFTNMYGDSQAWSTQKNIVFTVLSFINTVKYPPSLLYLCMTIGPAFLALAFLEKIKNRFSKFMIVFGRTAFFYYILHIYLIHFLATVAFFMRGHTFEDVAKVGANYPFLFVVPGEGVSLGLVYGLWILVIAVLYPLCKWYDVYKTRHKEKWWLSYL